MDLTTAVRRFGCMWFSFPIAALFACYVFRVDGACINSCLPTSLGFSIPFDLLPEIAGPILLIDHLRFEQEMEKES